MACDQPAIATLPLLGCCGPTGPPLMQIARAVSIVTVKTFHIHSLPGSPFFCGTKFFRQCDVVAVDNGRCGFPVSARDSSASIPLFAANDTGIYDPCAASDILFILPPTVFGDSSLSCRLSPGGGLDCWDATYTLSVETLPADIKALALSNLALIDLNAVPFGTQRTVFNDFFTGAAVFSDALINTNPPLPDACGSAFAHTLAGSYAFRYEGSGLVAHCDQTGTARISMPVFTLSATASRSRFSANATWCKRTRGPILTDPDFSATCNSQPAACSEVECVHHLPATGMIEVPTFNQSVDIGLCNSPAAPCNVTPIAF